MKHSDGRHATLSILHVFCLALYLYFIRLDIELDGAVLALQMESVFIALTGFFLFVGWHYAVKNKLITNTVTKKEQDEIYLKLLPEPITGVITFPFAVFGPNIWTLSWLFIFPVSIILKRFWTTVKSDKSPKKENDPNSK